MLVMRSWIGRKVQKKPKMMNVDNYVEMVVLSCDCCVWEDVDRKVDIKNKSFPTKRKQRKGMKKIKEWILLRY